MYKLRFHLGAGINFQHWQVKGPNGISYHKPDEVTIRAYNVTLKNAPKVAFRIYSGQHKTVCAWLQCENLQILPREDFPIENLTYLNFNPRIFPHWTTGDGWNLDGKFVGEIVTIGRQVLTPWAPYVIIGALQKTLAKKKSDEKQ